jgi:hypothetical protein
VSGGETRGRILRSKEGMVEGVEGVSCALEGVVIHSLSKEVHGPGHVALGWVLKVGGLVGELHC